MPRNSGGTYTLPTGNPVISGTLITSIWANATMPDLGAEITNSLDRYGRGPMLGVLALVDGNVAAPGAAFNTEPTTGFYRAGAGDLRATILGTARLSITAAGISVTGKALTPTSTQTFSATPTFNANLSNVFEMGALTANVTAITITNPTAGQTILIRILQDGTGGRTVAAPAGANVAGSVNTAVNSVSLLTLTYSLAGARWEGAWTQLS